MACEGAETFRINYSYEMKQTKRTSIGDCVRIRMCPVISCNNNLWKSQSNFMRFLLQSHGRENQQGKRRRHQIHHSHRGVSHALLVGYQVNGSIPLRGIQPDKSADGVNRFKYILGKALPPHLVCSVPQWHSASVATVTQSASNP